MQIARSKLRFWQVAGTISILGVLAIGSTNAWVIASSGGLTYTKLTSVPSRTVAIVPGARVYLGQPLSILENRLGAALALYQSGRVKAILVSGNNTDESPEVRVMQEWLHERGVPLDDIRADSGGVRTRETMVRASSVFNVNDAVVCTETLSMPRSLFLAQQAGIDAVGLALPTELSRMPRWVGREGLKNTLAFVESWVRPQTQTTRQEFAQR
jgi:SanA protein